MTDKWQAGTTYVPGSIVIPTHSSVPQFAQINNPSFETGDLTDWSLTGSGSWTVSNNSAYQGTYCLNVTGSVSPSTGTLANNVRAACTAGMSVTAQGFIRFTNAGADDQSVTLYLQFFDAGGASLGYFGGAPVGGTGGYWESFSVTQVAPKNAATMTVFIGVNNGTHGGSVSIDALSWTYSYPSPPPGLVYQATQSGVGKSGATEPNWPGTTGVPVTDNTVTWDGIIATQLVWTAVPINQSGATEPTWPTTVGSSVNDNGINWVAYAFNIQDANCPNTKVVQIAASKIYAADDDIVRYSATANPLDWSSANNAGYLPFGLQTYGSNPAAAMGLYRSNLVIFSAEGFQMWQVNEDPSVTALISALPIASTWNQAMSPLTNDLLFLSKNGVRSLGTTASADGLETGDIGMPMDPVIKAFMTAAIADNTPILSTYVPEYSQYWIIFPQASLTATTTVFVYTLNQLGQPGKWSRYVFPFRIDYVTQLNGDLYLRSGDDVLMVDATAINDFEGDPREVGFQGIVQWLWLDDDLPGVNKQWHGCDITCQSGSPSVSMYYSQANLNLCTIPYGVPTDSKPGDFIPIPVFSPTVSLQVSFAPSNPWKIMMATLWIEDLAPMT